VVQGERQVVGNLTNLRDINKLIWKGVGGGVRARRTV
jgi:hypothetical protein